MEKVVLKANKRNVIGKQVKALRREGKLPGVIYGRHNDPINIELDARSSGRILARATSSSLITIELDGKEYPTLVREKQRDFIKNNLLHVDFLAVSMTEKLKAYVALRFKGVSLAVKDFNAILVHNIDQLHVECLPSDLPEYVEVDISTLANPGDGIRVGELPIPANVTLLDDPDMMVAVASASKIDAAMDALEEEDAELLAVGAPAEGEEPELSVDRGKKEEDEE